MAAPGAEKINSSTHGRPGWAGSQRCQGAACAGESVDRRMRVDENQQGGLATRWLRYAPPRGACAAHRKHSIFFLIRRPLRPHQWGSWMCSLRCSRSW